MLPKNEKTFDISVVGEVSGELYTGSFTCVCVPWGALRNRIARDEIRETGDLENVTTELYLRAKWLANVTSRLITWPDWWSGLNGGAKLLDDNVLKEVYDQCIEAEVEWRTSVKKKASEATQATPQA